MKTKYLIVCPKCKTTHDCTDQLEIWKMDFINKIKDLVEEMKSNGNKKRNNRRGMEIV